MIECCCRPRDGGVVAGIALGRGGRMGWRLDLGILRYISAAVAGRALSGETRMTHRRGAPGQITTDVAGVALDASRYVGSRFSQCIDGQIAAVVAS